MSKPYELNRPTDDKINAQDFLSFLFSGDADNKQFRSKVTIADVEELYEETK